MRAAGADPLPVRGERPADAHLVHADHVRRPGPRAGDRHQSLLVELGLERGDARLLQHRPERRREIEARRHAADPGVARRGIAQRGEPPQHRRDVFGEQASGLRFLEPPSQPVGHRPQDAVVVEVQLVRSRVDAGRRVFPADPFGHSRVGVLGDHRAEPVGRVEPFDARGHPSAEAPRARHRNRVDADDVARLVPEDPPGAPGRESQRVEAFVGDVAHRPPHEQRAARPHGGHRRARAASGWIGQAGARGLVIGGLRWDRQVEAGQR